MSLLKNTAGITLAVALTAPLGASTSSLGVAPEARAATTPTTTSAATATTAPAPTQRASRAQARAQFGHRTIQVASRYKGVPYRMGGTTPKGFDCSGYTRFVYGKLDKRIPRTSQQQFHAARKIKQPRRGDLLFYHSGGRNGRVYHVVIYAGNGQVWHAPQPGGRVKKGKIYAKHWTAGRF